MSFVILTITEDDSCGIEDVFSSFPTNETGEATFVKPHIQVVVMAAAVFANSNCCHCGSAAPVFLCPTD